MKVSFILPNTILVNQNIKQVKTNTKVTYNKKQFVIF